MLHDGLVQRFAGNDERAGSSARRPEPHVLTLAEDRELTAHERMRLDAHASLERIDEALVASRYGNDGLTARRELHLDEERCGRALGDRTDHVAHASGHDAYRDSAWQRRRRDVARLEITIVGRLHLLGRR